MVTSRPTKSSFTRKSNSLAWTLCSMCTPTPCQYTHILQASNSHSYYTPSPRPEAPMSFLRMCILEELFSTICHGCPRTSPTHTNGFHTHCHWRNERVTCEMKTNMWIASHFRQRKCSLQEPNLALRILCGTKDWENCTIFIFLHTLHCHQIRSSHRVCFCQITFAQSLCHNDSIWIKHFCI